MWVKICGLKTADDVQAVADLELDAVGLNFYSGSTRGINVETAVEISRALPAAVKKVGVFVDHTPSEILQIVQQVGLDYVQLHGHYQTSQAAELQGVELIWAHRLGPEGFCLLEQELESLGKLNATPFACLVDACVAGQYGGSGQTVDWTMLVEKYRVEEFPPLILAGGLKPENVQEAIGVVAPFGVDVASGVETQGRKDLGKCRQFVELARKIIG